jgi:DNA-binding XRE family transcriptional regulator
MSKTTLPYGIVNNLSSFISTERGKRITKLKENVRVYDIEQEIANHCNITLDGIKAIKLKKSTPSLPIALKIADYFKVNIADIFSLEEELEESEESENITKRVIPVKLINNGKKCKVDGCDYDIFCKGLCNSHYMKNRRYSSPSFKKKIVLDCKCGKAHYAKGFCKTCYHQQYSLSLKKSSNAI